MSSNNSSDAPSDSPAEPETTEKTSPETPAPQERVPERRAPSNHIYVGKKPVMSYAMSALIQLTHSDEIIVKARGMAISRAVDVAEIVTKRLGNEAFTVKDITIDTEELGMGEDMRNVSTIEIIVGKK